MISSFTHRCVRDLAWAVASPPLVSGVFENQEHRTHWWNHKMCLQEYADCLPALQTLDNNPQALLVHLERIKSKRLGLRFEGLVSFWLSSISPNYKLLAQNIQLNEIAGDTRSRTIGEVDFIVREVKTEKVVHLEVAVKFYLGTAPFENPYCWFGTNTQDQLGRKIDHLQQHQTQLLIHHPEQVTFSIDERQCLLKGRLFYPRNTGSTRVQTIAPKPVEDNHLRGSYLFRHELSNEEKYSPRQLVQLEKSEWLAELTHKDIADRNIQSAFAQEERSSCYAVIGHSQSKEKKEVERVFCLPETLVFPTCS